MNDQTSTEFHAKFILALAGLLVLPAVWSFFSAIYSATTTGQVLVISVGRYETVRKLVAWETGWARFVGPVLIVASLIVWRQARKTSPTWWVAVVLSAIGSILLLFSWWFASWNGVLFFVGMTTLIAVVLYAGSRYGRRAAYTIIALGFGLFVWRLTISL